MHPKDAGFDEYSLFHSLHTEDKGSRYANPTFLRNGALHGPLEGQYGEDTAVAFIAAFMKKHRDDPMFIYYPMALPHWPMVPTPDSEVWSDPSRRLEEDTKYFPDMVRYLDKNVGRLMQAIDDAGVADNTVLIFLADNGTDRQLSNLWGDGLTTGYCPL